MTPLSRDRRLEGAIGRVLWLGIMASSMCLAVGLVMTLAGSGEGVARLLLVTGLMLLLTTPAARVLISAVAYARQGDWLFVALTLVVLLELVASVVAAVSGARV